MAQTLSNLDLRLLQLFDAIYQLRNLSRAAETMGLTQPAVSLALGKMRGHFGNPLFVRTAAGMEPTPYAEALHALVRTSINAVQATIDFRMDFKPLESIRTFNICMTDVGQIVLLPGLLNVLRTAAPAVRVDVTSITDGTPRALESGDLDLAVGFMPNIEGRFFQQALFDEEFVCLARSDHPRIRRRLTLKQFQEEQHVVVKTSGTGHLVVDKAIQELGLVRKVAVQIPNFIGLATVVGATDYLCTLPRRAGQILARTPGVKEYTPPFKLQSYQVKQHWHERQHHDPAHVWLRALVVSLYRDASGLNIARQENG
jgi:DNA-binding transcriptional LysR family regulator